MAQRYRRPFVPSGRLRSSFLTLCAALALGACELDQPAELAPEPIRPVRVAEVAETGGGETAKLTGSIEAEDNISLAFRVGGQLIERSATVSRRG